MPTKSFALSDRERFSRKGHVTLMSVEKPVFLNDLYLSVFVRDETAHNPKSKAASSAGRLVGMSDEVFGKVVRETRALIANFDREGAFRGARSQMDRPARGRRGASIDQEIEHHLPHALDHER